MSTFAISQEVRNMMPNHPALNAAPVVNQHIMPQQNNTVPAQNTAQIQIIPSRRPVVRQKRRRPRREAFTVVSRSLNFTGAQKANKNKRPLNSYMAFRAFYRSLFPGLPQKEISAYLTKLWQCDPFQAKWAILAKAYSIIRDVIGKDKAPLKQFLEIACPAIGVIRVDNYLGSLNWVITINILGQRQIHQTSPPDMSIFSMSSSDYNLSEFNVIEICIARRYIPYQFANLNLFKTGEQGLMGVAHIRTPKEEFEYRAKIDPVGVAAEIFGFDTKNPFFEVSKAPFNPLLASVTNNGDDQMVELFQDFNQDTIEDPQEANEQYAWTGTMVDLFSADEAPLELNNLFDISEFNSTDITDAQALDELVNDDLFSQATAPGESLHYDFGDSY